MKLSFQDLIQKPITTRGLWHPATMSTILKNNGGVSGWKAANQSSRVQMRPSSVFARAVTAGHPWSEGPSMIKRPPPSQGESLPHLPAEAYDEGRSGAAGNRQTLVRAPSSCRKFRTVLDARGCAGSKLRPPTLLQKMNPST